jgi:predicted acylesterase/phospholipase RssA
MSLSSSVIPPSSLPSPSTLVISGGSTKGILVLGGLTFLEERGWLTTFDTYIGTSVGAIVCYLLIIGYTPLELITYICVNDIGDKLKMIDILNLLENKGAVSYEYVDEFLEKLTLEKVGHPLLLGDLYEIFKKKFIIVTYNLTLDLTEYVSTETHKEIPCLTALRMSSNLPLIFERFSHEGCEYVDGGISDNFPIALGVRESGEKGCIGFLTSTFFDEESSDRTNQTNHEANLGIATRSKNTMQYIYKLMFIPVIQRVEDQISEVSKLSANACTIIRLGYKGLPFFKFNLSTFEKLELFSCGYNQTKNELSKK